MTLSRRLLEQASDSFELEALRSAAIDRGSEQACARALGAFSGVAAPPVPVAPLAHVGSAALALKGIGVGLFLGVCGVVATGAVGRHRAETAVPSGAMSVQVAPRVAPQSPAAPGLPTSTAQESWPVAVAFAGNEAAEPGQTPTATESVGEDEPRGVRAVAQGSSPSRTTLSPVKAAERRSGANTALNTASGDVGANASQPSPLAREIALLDAARRSIAQGQAATAIASLDRRERDLPGGVLGPEATLLRVEALLLRGDRTNAEALAAGFLAQNPRGPHAERLRRLLGVKIP
jgi:hypothetical protein